jgi:flagellar hook-associated protein 3 FlgL
MTAARSSASGALGSQTTVSQREAIATEIESHRDAILDSFSSKFRGSYLFAGADSDTVPYEMLPSGSVSAYQGSATSVAVDIDRVRSVEVGLNGDTIARGTDIDDVFVELENLIDAVRAGDSAGVNSGLEALERAFDRANMAQSRVGADLQAIDATREGLETQRRASAARQAEARDANLPEAITAMAEADTAYRAALGATANVTRVSLMDYLR